MSATATSEITEHFFSTSVAAFTAGLAQLEAKIDPNEKPERNATYEELLKLLSDIRTACRELENEIGANDVVLRDTQQRYQEAIEPWLAKSWMMNHALTKPQGYAGDYQMLMAIYEAEAKTSGFGGYFDLFFLDTELGRAVPARKDLLQEFLEQQLAERTDGVSILNVACGPCREFAEGVAKPAGKKLDVTFVDYDEESLAFAEETVKHSEGTSYNFVRYNALRMQSPKRFIGEHGTFDIVYSVGLCDYLIDRQLIAMLKGWRGMLNDNGVLYVAFKDMHCYDKTDYQWLVDWFFLEREEEDCRRLFIDAGFKEENITMQRDATGIIMSFAATVGVSDAPKIERMDPAHGSVPQPASANIAAPSPRNPK